MDQLTQLAYELRFPWLLPAVALAVWACPVVWGVVILRWSRGLPVLPRQPRRPVPWTGLHLVLVVVVYLGSVAAAVLAAEWLLFAEFDPPSTIREAAQSGTVHTVVKLLAERDPRVLWVCMLSAVVVAPMVEEFFFRVLLQGWLEAGQRRLRPKMPTLRRWGALGPILITAFLFARLHFRVDTPMLSASRATVLMAADAAAKLLAMTFAVVLLRAGLGATASDLGWVREKFLGDVGLGLLAFAAVAAPLYMMQATLAAQLPKYIAPDPFVLFPFALVLGTLYYRTHRIVPAIVLHVSLNATSLGMALMMTQK